MVKGVLGLSIFFVVSINAFNKDHVERMNNGCKKLRGFDLSNAAILRIDFSECDAVGADFSGATFASGVDFTKADLRGACFDKAKLPHAHFQGALLGSYEQEVFVYKDNEKISCVLTLPTRLCNAFCAGANFDMAHVQGSLSCNNVLGLSNENLQKMVALTQQGALAQNMLPRSGGNTLEVLNMICPFASRHDVLSFGLTSKHRLIFLKCGHLRCPACDIANRSACRDVFVEFTCDKLCSAKKNINYHSVFCLDRISVVPEYTLLKVSSVPSISRSLSTDK